MMITLQDRYIIYHNILQQVYIDIFINLSSYMYTVMKMQDDQNGIKERPSKHYFAYTIRTAIVSIHKNFQKRFRILHSRDGPESEMFFSDVSNATCRIIAGSVAPGKDILRRL